MSIVAAGLLVSRVSFKDVGTPFRSADGKWLIPALVAFFVMFAFRAWRWSVLLGGTPFWKDVAREHHRLLLQRDLAAPGSARSRAAT